MKPKLTLLDKAILTVILIALLSLMFVVTLSITQNLRISEGDRIGTIVKFSKGGLFFQTWEGQLAREGQAAGGEDTLFQFSIDRKNHYGLNNEINRATIQQAMIDGSTIKLSYKKEMFAVPWRGETPYMVTNVEVLNR